MGFWFFMTVSNLLLPVLMIIIGTVFVKRPPRTINGIYGYRTRRSMQNQDTWKFAHLYCGKVWQKLGWCMLPLSIAVMFPVVGKNDDVVGGMGVVVITVECMAMLVSILLTERALGKRY